MQKLPQTQEKLTAMRSFWQPKSEDTATHAETWSAFSNRIHVKLVTQTGFFPHLSLKYNYIYFIINTDECIWTNKAVLKNKTK